MSHAIRKRQNLENIELALWDHAAGFTRSELARKIDVDPGTITKDLKDGDLPHVYEEGNKLKIDRYGNLARVTFDLDEITMLHIAARLLARQTNQHNPHAASALRKLAKVVNRADENISHYLSMAADSTDNEQQVRNQEYLNTLQILTEARTKHRKVTVEYEVEDDKWIPYTFSPYFIEPYAPGLTTHVIGFREPPRKIRTFKLERLRSAKLTHTDFLMPTDFDPQALLEYAWGIWYTDEEPELVELKFTKQVRRRVLETRWHRKQQEPEILADGSVIWRCLIAEPKEMEYWVRGWGADVEVMKPAELRAKIEKGVRELVTLYNVAELPPVPTYQRLWAKTSKDKQRTHPLICHLIDVGQAALALWNQSFTDSLRYQFASLMGLENDLDAAGRTIAFWIALHDLGKASPAFQRMYKPAIAALEAAKLIFPPPIGKQKIWHATITAVTLDSLLSPTLHLRSRKKIAEALSGHHGAWSSAQVLDEHREIERIVGNDDWQAVRAEFVRVLQTLFQPSELCKFSQDQAEFNSFLTLFSGMTTVADWIGSMEEYFSYVDALPLDLENYREQAAKKAHLALKELHWTEWQPPQQAASFIELFPYLTNGPSPMQQEVIRLAEKLTQPSLVIIEAPTGSGKTEAALYLADYWAHRLQQRGLYVAMPTMATSNQMFSRVTEFLERRYPDQSVAPLLIHSQARWMQEEPPPEIDTEEESSTSEDGKSESEAQDMGWFLPRKRSLLAPCGVGTVDQTLLSVLQTRHFFVRLLGLSHKTIIFDEVHAYDVYMSELFQKLLQWLRAMNVSVVLLSATLPAKKRLELLTAYAGANCTPPADVAYPAITWAMDGACDVLPLPKPKDNPIMLEWVDRSSEAIVEKLRNLLSDGGCAAVICNTVARAQKLYDAILAAGVVDSEYLILFHARTRFGWRQKTEKDVLKLFGPGRDKSLRNPKRPNKSIVVATQVIEQSLDLDFDLMISDLAPIDLLIQRAGRLHRHPQNQAERKAKLTTPTMIVAASDTGEDLPDMEDDGHIYEPELLIRTYLSIHERDKLTLPSETPDLIKQVYSDLDLSQLETPAITAALAKAQQTKADHETKAKNAAVGKLILDVADERLLVQTNHQLDEEDPKVHQDFQAMTRLGPRTLSVVCLHEDESGKLYTEPGNGGELVKLSQKPDAALTQSLALSTLSISHQGIVHHLLKQADAKPTGWSKHALLRHHYVLRFQDGSTTLSGTDYRLTLHEKTGLTIEKLPKSA